MGEPCPMNNTGISWSVSSRLSVYFLNAPNPLILANAANDPKNCFLFITKKHWMQDNRLAYRFALTFGKKGQVFRYMVMASDLAAANRVMSAFRWDERRVGKS